MAQVRLEPGTWGTIKAVKVGPNKWQARTNYRDWNGERVPVRFSGSTKTRAIKALNDDLLRRRDGNSNSRSSSITLSDVLEHWIEYRKKTSGDSTTLDEYARIARNSIGKNIGELRLSEITTQICSQYLRGCLTPNGGGQRKAEQHKTVLVQALNWAAEEGLTNASNPAAPVTLPRKQKKEIEILNPGLVKPFLEAIRVHEEAPYDRPGPKPQRDIYDAVALFFSTGFRISELMGLELKHIDLDSLVPTLTVERPVIRTDARGIHLGEKMKTPKSSRTIPLSPLAVNILKARMANDLGPNTYGTVFTSRTGGLRDPHNWRRRWRKIRSELNSQAAGLEHLIDSDMDGVTPQMFRRTVATHLAWATGEIENASATLGHEGSANTLKYYLKPNSLAPDMREHFEAMTGTGLLPEEERQKDGDPQ